MCGKLMSCAIGGLFAVALSPHALADDVEPPPFRGEPLSVFAEWDLNLDFGQDGPTSDPFAGFDGTGRDPDQFEFTDDVGDPSTFLYEAAPPKMTGSPGTGSNNYNTFVPNWVDEEWVKYLRIQLTWLSSNPTGPGDEPVIFINAGDPSAKVLVVPAGQFNAVIFSGGTWGAVTVYDFELYPNPDWEEIAITTTREDIFIDQVVVDSVSTPEPTSLALLGVAGLAIARRRH